MIPTPTTARRETHCWGEILDSRLTQPLPGSRGPGKPNGKRCTLGTGVRTRSPGSKELSWWGFHFGGKVSTPTYLVPLGGRGSTWTGLGPESLSIDPRLPLYEYRIGGFPYIRRLNLNRPHSRDPKSDMVRPYIPCRTTRPYPLSLTSRTELIVSESSKNNSNNIKEFIYKKKVNDIRESW